MDVRIRRTDLPKKTNSLFIHEWFLIVNRLLKSIYQKGMRRKIVLWQKQIGSARNLATAKKEAALIHAEGEAEAAKIYNEAFSKDPEFYQLYRTLESYKKTIGDDTVIILPSDSPYAKVLSG